MWSGIILPKELDTHLVFDGLSLGSHTFSCPEKMPSVDLISATNSRPEQYKKVELRSKKVAASHVSLSHGVFQSVPTGTLPLLPVNSGRFTHHIGATKHCSFSVMLCCCQAWLPWPVNRGGFPSTAQTLRWPRHWKLMLHPLCICTLGGPRYSTVVPKEPQPIPGV